MRKIGEYSYPTGYLPDPVANDQLLADYDSAEANPAIIQLAGLLMAAERFRSAEWVKPAPIYIQLACALNDPEIRAGILRTLPKDQ